MALIPGYSGSSLNRFGRSLVLAVGDSIGVRSVTLTADATFDAASGTILSLNGGASDRNVDAVASAEVAGMVKVIKNAGTTNALTVRDAATTTVLATLAPGQWAGFFHTGAAWVAVNPSSVGNAHTKTSTTTKKAWRRQRADVCRFGGPRAQPQLRYCNYEWKTHQP